MAQLHSLIRLRRHELDEKRKILADLNKELEHLYARKQKLLDDLAREKDLAAVDMDCARHFPNFLNRTMQQVDALNTAIQSKLLEIQAATLVVQEAYLEAKKLEIAQENRDKAEAERLQKIEDAQMDEIGLEGFRRHTKEESA